MTNDVRPDVTAKGKIIFNTKLFYNIFTAGLI